MLSNIEKVNNSFHCALLMRELLLLLVTTLLLVLVDVSNPKDYYDCYYYCYTFSAGNELCASDGLPESSKDRQRCICSGASCFTQDKCLLTGHSSSLSLTLLWVLLSSDVDCIKCAHREFSSMYSFVTGILYTQVASNSQQVINTEH